MKTKKLQIRKGPDGWIVTGLASGSESPAVFATWSEAMAVANLAAAIRRHYAQKRAERMRSWF